MMVNRNNRLVNSGMLFNFSNVSLSITNCYVITIYHMAKFRPLAAADPGGGGGGLGATGIHGIHDSNNRSIMKTVHCNATLILWQEELPLSFRARDRVRTRCLQGVGVAIFRMGGADSQSGGRRRSRGYDVITLASDWRTHK